MRQPIAYLSKMWATVPCALTNVWRARHGQPPSLSCWLRAHPAVADSIKWQFTFETSAYDIPETAKRAWPAWTTLEQQDLIQAYERAWQWLYRQPSQFANLNETLQYPPTNLEDTSTDTAMPYMLVDPAWARDLYLRWIGLNLAVEIGGHVPWSITGYTAEELQVLFDSASFLSLLGNGNFRVCAGNPAHPNFVKRKDNLGASLIAPPRYTLAFLRNANLVGATRAETISRLLDWARDNLVHFYGAADYGTMQEHWQYRGLPPITRVVEGTTSTYPGNGRALDGRLPGDGGARPKRLARGKHPGAHPPRLHARATPVPDRGHLPRSRRRPVQPRLQGERTSCGRPASRRGDVHVLVRDEPGEPGHELHQRRPSRGRTHSTLI